MFGYTKSKMINFNVVVFKKNKVLYDFIEWCGFRNVTKRKQLKLLKELQQLSQILKHKRSEQKKTYWCKDCQSLVDFIYILSPYIDGFNRYDHSKCELEARIAKFREDCQYTISNINFENLVKELEDFFNHQQTIQKLNVDIEELEHKIQEIKLQLDIS